MAIHFHTGSTRLAHNADDLRERQEYRAATDVPSDAEGYVQAVFAYLERKLQGGVPNYGFVRAEALAGWKRGLMFWDTGDWILDALGPDAGLLA